MLIPSTRSPWRSCMSFWNLDSIKKSKNSFVCSVDTWVKKTKQIKINVESQKLKVFNRLILNYIIITDLRKSCWRLSNCWFTIPRFHILSYLLMFPNASVICSPSVAMQKHAAANTSEQQFFKILHFSGLHVCTLILSLCFTVTMTNCFECVDAFYQFLCMYQFSLEDQL